ncbi:Electron transport complex protein RnfG [Sterolibacterium denitrificans]|uniref:Electron transport complex protein RnfG n=2 Tax=Sterolibacterium denitrificans TaxID=157592 RepID=A0A7Z7MWA8_9PROT|nr:electron transport complex subunit RsxG [Sterolibacterium denitrificans]KYC29153.1 electron transporter RnfG [Sterolibacterium denitrificans]SMB29287.1 Electron transport complex protein RnfG [Sterolibacterium denitrificans]
MSSPQTASPLGILNISLRTATVLLLFTLVFTTLMAVVHGATKAPIAASVEAEKLKLIGEVLPAEAYDNDLLKDAVELPATAALGLDQPSQVYRARKAGAPAALVFEAAAPDGYSGRIGLILAVRTDGELLAVRVVAHKETPGLGDYIDPHKDKNKERPWIRQFDRQSLARLPTERWRVQKDGGAFEQRSGATISARAVTNAVARAMHWAAAHQQELFDSAPVSAAGLSGTQL